jgi:hypothetical protein
VPEIGPSRSLEIMKLAISALPVLLVAACETPVPDEAGEALFDPTVLHQVAIEMDATQWNRLRANVERDTDYRSTVRISSTSPPRWPSRTATA